MRGAILKVVLTGRYSYRGSHRYVPCLPGRNTSPNEKGIVRFEKDPEEYYSSKTYEEKWDLAYYAIFLQKNLHTPDSGANQV